MRAKKTTEHDALRDLYSPRMVSKIDSFIDGILSDLEKQGAPIEKNHVTISTILQELIDIRFEERLMARILARRESVKDPESDIRHMRFTYTKDDGGRIKSKRYDADRPRMKPGARGPIG